MHQQRASADDCHARSKACVPECPHTYTLQQGLYLLYVVVPIPNYGTAPFFAKEHEGTIGLGCATCRFPMMKSVADVCPRRVTCVPDLRSCRSTRRLHGRCRPLRLLGPSLQPRCHMRDTVDDVGERDFVCLVLLGSNGNLPRK